VTWTVVARRDLPAASVLDQSTGFRSASGGPVSPTQLDTCAARSPVRKLDPDCLRSLGLQEAGVATYQPGGRFWRFQVMEAALYAGLAVLLVGIATWRI